MFFLKKVILGIAAFVFILWGGAGTQSNNILIQGGGFIGLIIGLVILYIFTKMAWRAMGCLPSFLIFSGIVCFIIYAIGGFNNGFTNIGRNIKTFTGQNSSTDSQGNSQGALMLEDIPTENFADNANYREEYSDRNQESSEPNAFQRFVNTVTGNEDKNNQPLNPENFPAIYGKAKVINGDTLKINGYYLRLYGIDAPESNQTCAGSQGRSYRCGEEAEKWLRSWIEDNVIECRVMQQDENGNMVGTCSLGAYDLGVAIVNAGWAVAYLKYTDIYYPYEENARNNRVGLWQGQFYMPWDWRLMQAQKPKIKIIKQKKSRKKSLLDV